MKINKLSISTLIYFGSNLINGLIPFVFLKIITDFVSPEEFGVLSMYEIFIFLLIPFAGFNSGTALNRFYFIKELNYQKVFYNILILTLFSIVLLFGLAFVFDNYITSYFKFRPFWVYFLVMYQLVNRVSEYLLITYQVKEKPLSYGKFRIFKTSMDVLFSILFVLYFEDKLNGRVSGQLVGLGIVGLISMIIILKEKLIIFEYDKKYIKKILHYSVPLIPHAIGGFILNLSDRLILKHYCGYEQVGLYVVGYQIGMIISMVQNSFNQAWVPWFFKQLNYGTHEIKLKIVKYTYLYIISILAISFMLYLFSPLLFEYVLRKEYRAAIVFIPYVALGFAFNGMYKMMVNYLFYIKKTKVIGLMTFIIAISNIGLNIILIPEIGAVGAAIATTISYAAQFLFFAIFTMKNYKMPWLLK